MADKKITVYTGDECSESKRIISILEEIDVAYEEKNVSENRAYLSELQSKNIYSTPVIFIGEQAVLGYQKQKIEKLLQLS